MTNLEKLQDTLQEIYNAAIEAMSGLLDTRNMYIALYDKDTGMIEFSLAYEHGRPVPAEEKVEGKPWAPRPFGARKGLTEWVIRHTMPLLIERDFDAWVKAQADIEVYDMATKCWLGAPMVFRDEVIGVIGLQNFEREGVFDRNHRDLLMTIANQAATAIENARLLRRTVQAEAERYEVFQQIAGERKRRLELLQQISERMAEASLNPDGVLMLVAQAANDISHSDLASIYRYDQESARFSKGVRVYRQGDIEQLGALNLVDFRDLPAEIAQKQTAIFINDVEQAPDRFAFVRRHHLRAFAGLPLTIAGRYGGRATVGVLFVNFKQPHLFSEDEQEILRHLANQAAVAIDYTGMQEAAQAKEQLAALGTAAATLQHRLGNTINIILPAIMRLRYRVSNDPAYNEILDTIERNVHFATEVIQRMQSPLREEPFVRTNFNSLLQEAIQKCLGENDRFPMARLVTNLPNLAGNDFAGPTGPDRPIVITGTLQESLPETFASIGQLTEVFRVLIENAIKAIHPQAGTVTITSKLEADRPRQFVEIMVSDTGKGIDDNTKSKLFKQPVPRKEFGEGAGLGLWLSQIIVRSHQGTIRLHDTKLNEGSTFLVRLPVLDQPPPGFTS